MDYQAGSLTFKIINITKTTLVARVVFVFFLTTLFSCTGVFASTTTNPLYQEVIIFAQVPIPPNAVPPQEPQPPAPPGPINLIDTKDVAIFKGLAYPGSTISLTKNGVLMAQMPASPNGTFEIRVRNLDAGTYTFGIRAEDREALTSKLLSFTIFVTVGITTVVDGIFMPPTITSDKVEVKQGEVITFMGQSVPNGEVRLSFHSAFELLKKTKANSTGAWIYKLDSRELELGDHESKARSLTEEDLSPYSDILPFRISNVTRDRQKVKSLAGFRQKCDLNNDSRVNLIDFSIMAYWYKRTGFPEKVDLNTDKAINLTDLSILAFCWTG